MCVRFSLLIGCCVIDVFIILLQGNVVSLPISPTGSIASVPQMLTSVTSSQVGAIATLANSAAGLGASQPLSISTPVLLTGNQITTVADPTFVLGNQVVSIGNQVVSLGNQVVSIGNQVISVGNEEVYNSVSNTVINDVVPDTVVSLMEHINPVPASQTCLVQTLPFVDTLAESQVVKSDTFPAPIVQVSMGALSSGVIPETAQSYITEELNGQSLEGGVMQEETYIAIPITEGYTDSNTGDMYSQISSADPNMQFSTGQFIEHQTIDLNSASEQNFNQDEMADMTECNQVVTKMSTSSDVNNLTSIMVDGTLLNVQGQVISNENMGIVYDTVSEIGASGDAVEEGMVPGQEIVCTEDVGLEVIQGQYGYMEADDGQMDTS